MPLATAKGAASLVGGQLIEQTSWETPELFRFTALVSGAASLVFAATYYLLIWRKDERVQMEARLEVIRRIKVSRGSCSSSCFCCCCCRSVSRRINVGNLGFQKRHNTG